MTGPLKLMPTTHTTAVISASLVLALAASTLAGWALHIPVMVQLHAGWTPMVVNTGIGFALAGLALLAGASDRHLGRVVSAVLGGLVALLAIEELVVLWLDLSPAFSLPELHRPVQPEYPHPGRMAPNTALAFLMFGAGVCVLSTRSARANRFARNAAAGVLTLGAMGMLGYALQLEYLYGWAGVVRMAMHTAAGMLMLGTSLLALAGAGHARLQPEEEGEAQIGQVFLTAAVLLLVTSLSAGIAGFAFLQSQVEAEARRGLLQVTRDRVLMFELNLPNRSVHAQLALDDIGNLLASESGMDAPSRDALLQARAKKLAENGFSFMALRHGAIEHTLAGTPVPRARFRVPISGRYPGELIWDGQFILRRVLSMDASGLADTALVTEQPLPILTKIDAETNALGETTEMIVCTPAGTGVRCFPARHQRQPFRAPRIVSGQRLPMEHALHGEIGTMVGLDYLGHRVLASYSPVGDTGLGLVTKRDVAEIYAPIRQQFERILLFLLALLGASLWILRRQLVPVLAALDHSRRTAMAGMAKAEAAMESNIDGFFILECMRDEAGEIVDMRYAMMNAAAEKILGRPRTEVIGRGMCECYPPLRDDGMLAACKKVVSTGGTLLLERASVVRAMHWYESQLTKLGDGVSLGMRDVTTARDAVALIRHQSLHDPLTGAVNRIGFNAALAAALADAERTGEMVAIGIMDIDRFKALNDRRGHLAGDKLLEVVASRLKGCLRPLDTVARFGGDEFVVVLRNIQLEALTIIEAKLSAALNQPAKIDGEMVQVSVSLGLSVYPRDGSEQDELLKVADAAMYTAKRRTRKSDA
ncbi:MAG: diguanylate cyclase [Luteimonas sp.]